MVVVMAVPALTGSQCVFVASSGNNNACKPTIDKPCDSQNNTDPVVVVAVDNGQLIDAPVQGVRYESGTLAGITGNSGEFRYEVGNTVRFFIGDKKIKKKNSNLQVGVIFFNKLYKKE